MFKKKDNDNLQKEKNNRREKKEKKQSSSFFSNLNSDSTIEYGLAEKNPKSKWAKWIIAGLIGGVTVVGVAVPWSLSSCVVALKKPFADSEIMYTYIDPITKKVISVTYEEFERRTTSSTEVAQSVLDKWDEIFYKSVLEELYNEEREAYLKFKAIYEKLHKDDDNAAKLSDFGADLSTKFSDIEKEKREILEKNKNSFKKATNSENWIQDWIEELKTNSIYGPQSADNTTTNVKTLEEKAIAHMVSQQIKDSALARFKGASITTTTWNYIDYNFANQTSSGEEVYTSYTNNEGKKVEIKKSEAISIWKAYLTKDENVVQASNITTSNNKKIAVFETKSYSTSFRNPLKNIESNSSSSVKQTQENELIKMINENFNLGLISSIDITGIKPGEKNGSPFTIDSETLKSLLKVQNTNTISSASNFIPLSRIFSFQGANTINTSTDKNDQNAINNYKDELIVKTFNTDETTNKQLGSSKLVETKSFLETSSSSSDDSTSTEETTSTLNLFGLAALSSFEETATNPTPSSTTENNDLFSINSKNPLETFFDILFTLGNQTNTNSNNELQFNNGNTYVKTNWDKLSYGSIIASSELVEFVKVITSNIVTSTTQSNGKTKYEFLGNINAATFNSQLENAISSLSDNDYTFMGKLLNAIMIGENQSIKTNYNSNISPFNQYGYWTLYKLSSSTNSNTKADTSTAQTYMYVSQDGIKIFSKTFKTFDSETLKSMVISDLNQTINVADEETPTLYYDVASVFNKLNNDNLIIIELLKDETNVTTFKDSLKEYVKSENTNLSDEEVSSKVEEIYKDFLSDANLNYNESNLTTISTILNNVPTSLETIISTGRVYDFATINVNGENLAAFQTQTKFSNNSIAQGQENINALFIEKIKKLLTVNSQVNQKYLDKIQGGSK